MRPLALVLTLLLMGARVAVAGSPPQAQHEALAGRIDAIARQIGGQVGVGVQQVAGPAAFWRHADEPFPMGSVFKLPLAVALLREVQAGSLSLSEPLEVGPADLRPGSGRMAQAFTGAAAWPVERLLHDMMVHSDNTATDRLWTRLGGAPVVRAHLVRLGISGISVDRPSGLLLAAALGLGELGAHEAPTPSTLDALLREQPLAERRRRQAAFLNDARDTATPRALVALLQSVQGGQALDQGGTRLLLDLMRRCETGRGRLRGRLPPAAEVAHKTGTLRPHVVNDVGLIGLPGYGQRLAIAVLIKGSRAPVAEQEAAIAQVALAVVEHFANGPIPLTPRSAR